VCVQEGDVDPNAYDNTVLVAYETTNLISVTVRCGVRKEIEVPFKSGGN